jgi:hypothetical protein
MDNILIFQDSGMCIQFTKMEYLFVSLVQNECDNLRVSLCYFTNRLVKSASNV